MRRFFEFLFPTAATRRRQWERDEMTHQSHLVETPRVHGAEVDLQIATDVVANAPEEHDLAARLKNRCLPAGELGILTRPGYPQISLGGTPSKPLSERLQPLAPIVKWVAIIAIALAAIWLLAGALHGLGTALSSRPSSSSVATDATVQDKAGILQTPAASVTQTGPSSWKVVLPANQEWMPTGIRGKISGTASGEANAGAGNPQATPAGASERVMAEWNGHPYLLPNVPEGTLVGKDGQNGQPFILGSSFSGINVADELYVSFNDATGTFANNEGGYNIPITTQ